MNCESLLKTTENIIAEDYVALLVMLVDELKCKVQVQREV